MPRSFLVKKAEIRSTAFLDGTQKQSDFIAVGNMSVQGNVSLYSLIIVFCYIKSQSFHISPARYARLSFTKFPACIIASSILV